MLHILAWLPRSSNPSLQSNFQLNHTFSLIDISSNKRQRYRSFSNIFCREWRSASKTWVLMPVPKGTVSRDFKVRPDERGNNVRRRMQDFRLRLSQNSFSKIPPPSPWLVSNTPKRMQDFRLCLSQNSFSKIPPPSPWLVSNIPKRMQDFRLCLSQNSFSKIPPPSPWLVSTIPKRMQDFRLCLSQNSFSKIPPPSPWLVSTIPKRMLDFRLC